VVNSKKLLALLVAIFVYINVYVPLSENNSKEISKLLLYQSKLEAEKSFFEKESEAQTYINLSEKNLAENEMLMYPASMQDAIVFNKIQTKIKTLIKQYQGKVVNVLWGEPYKQDEASYMIMPFTFIIEIEPEDSPKFFNELFNSSKAMTIKQAFFVKKKNMIVINMQVNLYKNGSKL